MADTNQTAQVDGAGAGQQEERLYGAGAWNTVQAHTGISSSNPGPKNVNIISLAPDSDCPPATDHGSVGTLWHSFELTHRRVQKGGWTHQVTEREVPLSKEIAGVNMRIVGGAFREAHWHSADEWAYMLTGKARITLFGSDGSMFVDDVQAGDLWNFPAGLPHSIQGLEEDGCEFLGFKRLWSCSGISLSYSKQKGVWIYRHSRRGPCRGHLPFYRSTRGIRSCVAAP